MQDQYETSEYTLSNVCRTLEHLSFVIVCCVFAREIIVKWPFFQSLKD